MRKQQISRKGSTTTIIGNETSSTAVNEEKVGDRDSSNLPADDEDGNSSDEESSSSNTPTNSTINHAIITYSARKSHAILAGKQTHANWNLAILDQWQLGINSSIFSFLSSPQPNNKMNGEQKNEETDSNVEKFDITGQRGDEAAGVGDLYIWGTSSLNDSSSNISGAGSNSHLLPRRLESLNEIDVYRISCGSKFIGALDDCGDLYMYGNGNDGQLGVGYVGSGYIHHGSKRKVRVPHRVQTTPMLDGVNVELMSSGARHAAAITSDKKLYVWGDNR